ncbi:MAG: class I tRNA ligase family protein, partial [Methyloceanibacter sp.]
MAKSKKSGRASAKTARAKSAARKPKAALKSKAAPKRKLAKAAAKRKGSKAKATKPKTKLKTATKPKAKAAPKRPAKPRSPRAKPKASRATARIEVPKPASLIARLEAENRKVQTGRDWSETLFLPKTDFPMKAGLPEREPELLKRWERLGLYARLRQEARGREAFVLHDGPPYANANIHIGTGLNKILKDVVVRSQQMMGKDANYVPGWDCHGLPIEWRVEEENYRTKGKSKPDLSDSAAMIAFRAECRAYAEHWLNVQRE